MKIGIGNDHVAVEYKNVIREYIEAKYGYEVINYGTDSSERFNYPVSGEAVANAVVNGEVDKGGLTNFLDKVIPRHTSEVKDRLGCGEELTLLTRFEIYIDLVKGVRRFAIPDMGIKLKEVSFPIMCTISIKGNWWMEKSGAL